MRSDAVSNGCSIKSPNTDCQWGSGVGTPMEKGSLGKYEQSRGSQLLEGTAVLCFYLILIKSSNGGPMHWKFLHK